MLYGDRIPISQGACSPKMETITASVSPMYAQKSVSKQNGVPYKKKMRLEDEDYDSLEMACNLTSEIADDCEAFGRHVAAQLRLMTRMQKFMAVRLISEICFRGQIQHLSLSTNIVNSSQQQSQQQQQTHLQAQPVFPRPPHISTASIYARLPDYSMLHQQGMRAPNLPPFQGFMQPQQEHGHLESVGPNFSSS
ncbi:uncharacterized protein [Parasteatoda tepidariorum]|uniref:uncharacterized protein isoform X2 n=1 Tax=Parasteatoda tepidariorum TaxID=114398 RepID=UPI00077FDE7F|nr:uncharacterized protein LOC107437195 isoform X2 [Parasteatoda tepidariorum]